MTSKITIATAQTVIHNEVEHAFDGTSPPFPAIEANLTVMAAKIAAAASEGAEVVVFPEFCVQGIAREQWVSERVQLMSQPASQRIGRIYG
jgi:predicted amidohydrolase